MDFTFFQQNKTNIEDVRKEVLKKFPLLGVSMSNIKTKATNRIPTASTDGETIFYSPKFFNTLTPEEKVFAYSHEVMHVAFDHIMRSKGKDQNLWNIATDAVINQMLKQENLPILENCVNIEEALNKSAEEMYQTLLKEQNNDKQQNNQQNNQQQSNNNSSGNQQQNNQRTAQQQKVYDEQVKKQQETKGQVGHDDHSIWEEAIKRAENKSNKLKKKATNQEKKDDNEQEKKEDKNQEENNNNLQKHSNEFYNKVERNFCKINKFKKKELLEKLRKQRRVEHIGNKGPAGKGEIGGEFFCFDSNEIGKEKPLITWKKILRREFEKEEDRWCYRRACEDNDFCARIGSVETYEKPSTQVLLDTSGSIDDKLLRGFLKQLKPLLKESKLYVGCFDERFYGFSEITSNKDIDNFIFRGRGGTSFNNAIRCFSKDSKVNKIIFTDGRDEITYIPNEIKKYKIYWLVFDNKNFKPSIGKAIYIDKNQLQMSLQTERTF